MGSEEGTGIRPCYARRARNCGKWGHDAERGIGHRCTITVSTKKETRRRIAIRKIEVREVPRAVKDEKSC